LSQRGGVTLATIFFPLRTSVELFQEPASPKAVARAKQAAILYDRLVFEGGLLDVTIGEGSRAETVVPRAAVTRDLLQFSRTPVRQGTPFQVVLQAEEYPAGPPVGEAFEIIREPVAVRYVA
jgi:hypothetical protein